MVPVSITRAAREIAHMPGGIAFEDPAGVSFSGHNLYEKLDRRIPHDHAPTMRAVDDLTWLRWNDP